ncbi:MAG: uroporphyrinogen-III synthase [Acidobacteriaceae bacterium]|jgi:uroporphyrinogen-III synthase
MCGYQSQGEAITNSFNSVSDASRTPPLAGRRILVTRAPRQASELVDRLRELGATPILIPTIEIGPPGSYATLDTALAALSSIDLVAFTSANAVEAYRERAETLGVTATPARIAVVGPATARALEAIALHADVMPGTYTAEALGQTLAPEMRGCRVLLVLAEDAPATLRDALAAAGADVTVAVAYRNRIPEASLAAVTSLFGDAAGYPDAVTFTSASTAANLVALLDVAGLALPVSVVRASIGPITSRALRELGLPPHVEAAESTIPALVEALAAHFSAP